MLTFPTRRGALGHPNLLPVVLSVSSWGLTSRHLVVWRVRRKAARLDGWEGPPGLPGVSACLPMQIFLLIIHALRHIQLAVERLSWEGGRQEQIKIMSISLCSEPIPLRQEGNIPPRGSL